jgi:hypothetical protein
MDPFVIVIVVVVVTPVAVVLALAKSSQLRGPTMRPESRRRVQSLVTEAVPDDPSREDESVDGIAVDSPPPGSEREQGDRFER